jgi:hypothetical protein
VPQTRWVSRASSRSSSGRAGEDGVDPGVAGDRLAFGRGAAGGDPCQVGRDVGPRRRRGVGRGDDRVAERRDATAGGRGHGHDRAAEPPPEGRRVDLDPLGGRNVAERERDDDRQPELERQADEIAIALEIRGIDHHDHAVRLRHAGHAAMHHVDGDLLVGALGREAVGAGQIDEVDRATRVGEAADLLLHRDAGIVADPRGDAGERREERALAGVGVAEQRRGEVRASRRRLVHGRRAESRSCGEATARAPRGPPRRGGSTAGSRGPRVPRDPRAEPGRRRGRATPA